jgi:hypothetical protein
MNTNDPDFKCGNCRFWDNSDLRTQIGYCRRNAPSIPNGDGDLGRWPTTYQHAWCGEFKVSEAFCKHDIRCLEDN